MLAKAKGRTCVKLFGVMTLILGLGDSFHLVPRVLNYWTQGDYTAALGIGKLVTSITMTAFYLLLEYARRDRYMISGQKSVLTAAWMLSGVRTALCCFPQNEWTSAEPSLLWGILRNIPFAVLGMTSVVLWFKSAKTDKPLKYIWLATAMSFAFYLPVVVLSQQIPLAGMLMLPKTCMYVWMIVMFIKEERSTAAQQVKK